MALRKLKHSGANGDKYTLTEPNLVLYMEYMDFVKKEPDSPIRHSLFIVSKTCDQLKGKSMDEIANECSAIDILDMAKMVFDLFEKKS